MADAPDWSRLMAIWDGTNISTMYNTTPIFKLAELPALASGSADIGTVNTKYKPTTPTASYANGNKVAVAAGDATKTDTLTLGYPAYAARIHVETTTPTATNYFKIEHYDSADALLGTVVAKAYDGIKSDFVIDIPRSLAVNDYLKITYTNAAAAANNLIWFVSYLWTGLNPWGTAIANYALSATYPCGMAWDGTNLWVLCKSTLKIYKINPSDGSEISYISIPSQDWGALDYFNGYLYAGENTAPAQVHKIDPSDGTDISQWNGQGYIQGLANDGTYMYQADFTSKTIYKLNPTDGSVISSWGIAIDWMQGLAWDGTNLLMCSVSTDLIYKLNYGAQSIIETAATGTDMPNGLTHDGTNIWFCDGATERLYKVQG